jgi:hypothetical protein
MERSSCIIILVIIIIIIIIIIHLLHTVYLILKRVRSHWSSTSYSLYCQKLSDYTACVKYYCFRH